MNDIIVEKSQSGNLKLYHNKYIYNLQKIAIIYIEGLLG